MTLTVTVPKELEGLIAEMVEKGLLLASEEALLHGLYLLKDEYARKFGVTSPLPEVLPLALGSAEVTLYEQTAAFTTFPNDGVRVTPRYIRKVTDYDGHVREEDYPEVRDVIGVKTARIMTSLLQGVVQQGTATAALKLKHALAGKSGTTRRKSRRSLRKTG